MRGAAFDSAWPSVGSTRKLFWQTAQIGKLPLSAEHPANPSGRHPSRPPETSESVEFGAHLAAVRTSCHGANFAGGPLPFGSPDWPKAANLTRDPNALGSWSYDDFERAITQGVSKDGRQLREPMTSVLPAARAMSATERKALWTYLRSVAPVAG